MLRAAQKRKHNQLLTTLKTGTRNITSHRVYEQAQALHSEDRKQILDTFARVKHHVGFLRLNREHRYNTLTTNYIKGIKRALTTIDQDDRVNLIYMTAAKGEHFSNGSDFRSLLFNKKEDRLDKVAQYLEDLYSLQIQTAKLNKPLIAVAPGHSFNSGATFLQASGYPTTTLSSKIAFNEVTFGFVPHSGASYYLSRLPGEIGTFLAVTGLHMTGIDARELGVADNLVHYSEPYEEDIAQAMFSLDTPYPNYKFLSDDGRADIWKKRIQDRIEAENEEYVNDMLVRDRHKHKNFYHEEFMEPKDKIPSATADAEYKYKQALHKYNKAQGYDKQPAYLGEESGAIYQNYYDWVMQYIKLHSQMNNYPKDVKSVLRYTDVINRCFYPSKIEEIIELLKQENTPFAKACLEKMQCNSMLSMKLALKMVRQGKSLDYKGCLLNEINVALNKIQDSEFDLGIQEVLLKPGKIENPTLFKKNISDDQVQSFFQPNKWTDSVKLDVVEKAMLPTRFFYEKFSDQVRLWINESSTPQESVREYFQQELKESLRQQGIDIRDRALTIESARDALYAKQMQDRVQNEFNERFDTLLKDKKLRENYFSLVNQEINQLENSPTKFYELVNKHIQQIFENAYLEKLNMVYEKSLEAHNLEKRRMLIRFKKFLFKSRILTYAHEEFERTLAQLQALPFKEVHLTENWQQSYRDMEHPEIQRSPLWYLSKVVGKKNFTPPELAKQYLSNSKLNMTLFTFDKAELEKLRKDLFLNPEKYEIMLSQDKGTFKVSDRLDDRFRKNDEYEYWFRVLNDGRCPLDSLPYHKEFLAYKEFVDNVERKSLNTLRVLVQRLLMDFEKNEQIIEFKQEEKEGKYQAIQRLIKIVGNYEEKNKQIKKIENKQITSDKRSPADIKKIMNKLFEQDEQIRQILPTSTENISKNPLVNKFRNEAIDNFTQIIEFVLLNITDSSKVPRQLLEERLNQLMNAKNAGNNNTMSLSIIDSYLNEKNSENIIKQAIELAKPFFLAQFQQRLNDEARKVFDAFLLETTQPKVLFYYLFNVWHPDVANHPVMDKIATWNEDRDRQKYLDMIYPDMSHRYIYKQLVANLGSVPQIDKDLPIAEQEKRFEQAIKSQMQAIDKIKEEQIARENKWLQDVENMVNKKKELGQLTQSKEVEADRRFNMYQFDPHELGLYLTFHDRAFMFTNWMENNEKELQNSMLEGDWLHVYAHAINSYKLDFQGILSQSIPQNKYRGVNFLEKAQNALGGNRNLEWSDIADYAQFISEIYRNGASAFKDQKDINMLPQIAQQFAMVSGQVQENAFREQSVFELLRQSKLQKQRQSLSDELSDHIKIEKRLLDNKLKRQNIQMLIDTLSVDVKNKVNAIMDSQSKYLDLSALEKLLIQKIYSEIKAENILDKERLLRDASSLNIFKNYQQIKLDVVSLAEAKESLASSESLLDDNQIKNQMQVILDFVSQSLEYVPHDRRREITLGEFLKRHHYLSSSSLTQFANDILKSKIEQVLGAPIDIDKADFIDWEFAGVRTNPNTHKQVDEQIKNAMDQGKSVDFAAEIDTYVENNIQQRETNEYSNDRSMSTANPITLHYDENSKEYAQVLLDARETTQVRPEFIWFKNKYQNQVLQLYAAPEFDQKALEEIITEYTHLRLKDCMMSEDFRQKVHSNNGHLYMKMLKEQIADELQLANPPQPSDYAFMKNFDIKMEKFKIDFEGKYNLSDVNNESAIGYNNIEKRAGGSLSDKENRDLAHESMFDKLLADYFLNKRSQYKSSNQLLDDLDRQFGDVSYKDGHKFKTNDPNQIDHTAWQGQNEPGLTFAFLRQQQSKQYIAEIKPSDFTEMMELDIATAQALEKNRNGLSDELKELLDLKEKGYFEIPEHFNFFDVRKSPNKYVEDKLQRVLEDIFTVRRKIEKSLSRNELLAYDKVLASYLTKDILTQKLKQNIDSDYNLLHQVNQLLEQTNESEHNNELQSRKTQNDQAEYNKNLKNEDAMFKFLAYSAMLEKNRRADLNKTRKNHDIVYGLDSFDEFYKNQLQEDSLKPPREINPEDYQPKKGTVIDRQKAGEGFLTTAQREELYFKEFELYKENKREQQERTQLFFVLEQFFSHAKENANPLSQAQNAINEYFKDTENTQFFDKNKIQ